MFYFQSSLTANVTNGLTSYSLNYMPQTTMALLACRLLTVEQL